VQPRSSEFTNGSLLCHIVRWKDVLHLLPVMFVCVLLGSHSLTGYWSTQSEKCRYLSVWRLSLWSLLHHPRFHLFILFIYWYLTEGPTRL